MIDIVDRLRFDAVRCEAQFSKGVAGNIEEAAKEIERLREALKPFAEYYDLLERNRYLEGHMLISQQGEKILGTAGIQAPDLKAARDTLNQQEQANK